MNVVQLPMNTRVPESSQEPAMPTVVDARMLYHSGIGVYLRNILDRFTASKRPFAAATDRGLGEATPGHPVFPFNAPIYSIAEQLAFRRLKLPEPSLWWSPHYNIPLRHRGRLVATVHDVAHLALPQFFGDWRKQVYARFMFRALARKTDAVICVSQWTADELMKFTSVDHRKVHVVHNGLDESWFEPTPGPRPHPRPYLLFVGNVKPHKNLRLLAAAFALLKERTDLDLMIVGKKEGFITGDTFAFDVAEHVSQRIHFTGYVPDEVVKRYYAFADALVFPSLYEGFGLPPLEAMACGCPVIASSASCLPEVCGDAVVYCDPFSAEDLAEKIRLVLGFTGSERASFIEAGKVHARRFSWNVCAQSTWEILRDAKQ